MSAYQGYAYVADPIKFGRILWPDVYFYNKQREVIYSVVENDETVVVGSNESGKDFAAGFICVYYFLTRGFDPVTRIPYPCRIITTSAKDDHLRVLWGEINNFIQTARYPLLRDKGGPLIVNHQEIRRVYQSGPLKGMECPKSYMKGMVASAESIAALQGHHVPDVGDGVPRTLCVGDEASSINHEYFKMFRTWAKRRLYIGNAWECQNYFRHAIEGDPKTKDPGGDKPRKSVRGGFHRKVIRIEATDSPNIRYGLAEVESGKEPSGKVVVKGVKTWDQYQADLETMDEIQQTVSLRARWYKGKGLMMFPQDWLNASMRRAKEIRSKPRQAISMGVDTGEGKANSVWTISDWHGIIEQVSKKTPKSTTIRDETIGLIEDYELEPERVFFDRGGGGWEIAEFIREKGYNVQTVGFGEAVAEDPELGLVPIEERKKRREKRYAYFNRRAQMYMMLHFMLDPDRPQGPWAIPEEYYELIRQLTPIPLTYDSERRVKMLPKNRKPGQTKGVITLEDLIGCSPDEADSTILSVFGLHEEAVILEVG